MFKFAFFLLVIAAPSFSLASCSNEADADTSEPPVFVYVPASTFQQTVVVRAAIDIVQVGEPVVLAAEQQAGPFVRVPFDSLAEEICWWERQPPEYEPEVSSNLRWEVQPAGNARFNVEPREDHARTVIFSQ